MITDHANLQLVMVSDVVRVPRRKWSGVQHWRWSGVPRLRWKQGRGNAEIRDEQAQTIRSRTGAVQRKEKGKADKAEGQGNKKAMQNNVSKAET